MVLCSLRAGGLSVVQEAEVAASLTHIIAPGPGGGAGLCSRAAVGGGIAAR